ncbi:hypothetical protein HUU05_25455 [candidate division KSB1 bacterium]|nr:hypothetical protein [candidate division KSB1 bacterium]
MRRKIPAMSSKKLVKLVKDAGANFVRHGKGDHDIFERMVEGKERLRLSKWAKANCDRSIASWYFGSLA